MKSKWWQEAVVYQIYCKSFYDSNGDGIGDLPGVMEKLPQLKELGINCIWFTPIYTSPQVDNGYDVADYKDIDPAYGTLEDFKRLLDMAHSLGIKIVMDMVLNHSSDKCRWFQEAKKSRDNPYRNYYIWHDGKPDGSEPNNWGNYFYEGKGSAWEWDENTQQYYLHYYSKHMPDLNWEYEPLRQEVYAMMRWWLDMGVDGFRLDVITSLKKPEGFPDYPGQLEVNGYAIGREQRCNVPGIHEIIQEMNREVFSRYDCMTVGEASRVNSVTGADYIRADRKELDSLYHFDICHRLPKPPTVLEYKQAQMRWYKTLENNAWLAQHLSNHDYPRQVSRFGDDTTYRVESAKMLATLTHTMPGTPYVYQGEEIGMTNVEFPTIEQYNDPYTVGQYHALTKAGEPEETVWAKLRPISRDNPRTPYQWDDSENAGFTTGKPWLEVNPRYKEINVVADRAMENSIFAYYQKLIALRKENPAMVNGTLEMLLPEHPEVVMYLRKTCRQTLLVVCNFSGKEIRVELPAEVKAHGWQRILTNREDTIPSLERSRWLPWEAEIYELRC
ncbi:MAG: alpha-glucosidase [Oscillospiraceae bacterium]|nr:alpha-glucosidase [Oscillospiraceae bacterium]